MLHILLIAVAAMPPDRISKAGLPNLRLSPVRVSFSRQERIHVPSIERKIYET